MKNDELDHSPEEKVQIAHNFLKEFLQKFESAKRGGIHDFLELMLANMISTTVADIDRYLNSGHTKVIANEVCMIAANSCQKELDRIKKNLDDARQVEFV